MFEHLSPESKVWVYQADRPLLISEINTISSELISFVKEWAAHGSQLYGDAVVFYDRFIVLCVDETKTGVSGCSIDASVHKMKEIGSAHNINFFNRLNLVVEKENEFQYVHISDLKNYLGWSLFNPMVTNLEELRSSWKIRVEDSPFI